MSGSAWGMVAIAWEGVKHTAPRPIGANIGSGLAHPPRPISAEIGKTHPCPSPRGGVSGRRNNMMFGLDCRTIEKNNTNTLFLATPPCREGQGWVFPIDRRRSGLGGQASADRMLAPMAPRPGMSPGAGGFERLQGRTPHIRGAHRSPGPAAGRGCRPPARPRQ